MLFCAVTRRALQDRYGVYYNATDDDLMAGLAGARMPTDDLQAVVYHGWTASRHHVPPGGISLQNRSLHFTNPADRPIGFWSGRSSEGGQRFYLENSHIFLDGIGEWWLNVSTSPKQPAVLHYRPLPSEKNAAGVIDAVLPLVHELVQINHTRGISFQGVSLQHTDWQCGGADGTDPCDMQSVAWQDHAGVHIFNSSDITFTNCLIRHHGSQAVWIDAGSQRVSLSRCEISDLGTGAVRQLSRA